MLITNHQRHGGYIYISITDGKKTVNITNGPHGVDVCMQNASHATWKGLGKRFDTFEKAITAYKSQFMREAIKCASEII